MNNEWIETLSQNSAETWLASGVIFAAIFLGLRFALWLIHKRQQSLSTTTALSDIVFQVLGATKTIFIFLGALFFASIGLALPDPLRQIFQMMGIFSLVLQGGFWASVVINSAFDFRLKQELDAGENASVTNLNALKVISRVVLWVVVVLLVLDNIPGVQISALVASLGIGGIAVALAVQNILGDLFASLVIALDKPFVIGDTIQLTEGVGKIEYIGLKSTRVRLISGEQLIVSNTDLLNSRVRNMQKLERRRIVLLLTAAYETPPEVAREIPAILENIVRGLPDLTFDRAHLSVLADFSLTYELVYFVESSDFLLHMNNQQEILLAVHQQFAQKGITIPYPTQTIYLSKSE